LQDQTQELHTADGAGFHVLGFAVLVAIGHPPVFTAE
jgi:hypothetical protein